MPFPEKIRREVRERSAFRCCRCGEIGIEVHHIIPSTEGGPDNFDNAAPLCHNCHDRFGANPVKRKELTQMRDWWYEVVTEKWPTPDKQDEELNEVVVGEERDPGEIADLADRILTRLQVMEKRLQQDQSAAAVREAASSLVTATRLGDAVYADVHCQRCGSQTGLSIGSTACPECGEPYPT
jgi:hypothetical protein